ncbi:GDP-mannose-dependent alpha-(1-6)-phosphatidylinositol monomannoside mannosyltransferase (plasmid) [Streptomyces sp. ADI95-16]|uniref:glycosyltransferase n=1 Tax=Streptomyces sp. ADI95-16 TaxID=1522758 RepID=UPI000F433EBE|nr:glycosyltransferase [Streptomyces sp. ADI95-16]AYV32367.1 GDP-mannose-dependent alpha-(1-6)-phosphatidylinositol monomannoside mannosyltransferase [Streptomyces sp. ADI95-16]
MLLQFGDGRLYPSIRPALTSAHRVIRFCHSDYSHLRTRAKNALDRALTRSEDTIVAVGGRSTRFLLDDVQAPAHKVTTLTNAIEPRDPVQPDHHQPWAKHRPYVVAVQSLYPHKGHDALLRAHAHLNRTHPDLQLVVIGDGGQSIPLRALATTLGIADNVTWLGAVWHHDLVDRVLAGASAFVSMSRFEGLPISDDAATVAPLTCALRPRAAVCNPVTDHPRQPLQGGTPQARRPEQCPPPPSSPLSPDLHPAHSSSPSPPPRPLLLFSVPPPPLRLLSSRSTPSAVLRSPTPSYL